MKCIKCGKELTSSGDDYLNITCSVCKLKELTKTIIPASPVGMYGWICPRCGQVWSPFTSQCHCPPNTITSSTTENPKQQITKQTAMKTLYEITVRKGNSFYVIANSPNEASEEVLRLLTKAEWWFPDDRKVVNIKVLATEYHCFPEGRPVFGGNENLIIIQLTMETKDYKDMKTEGKTITHNLSEIEQCENRNNVKIIESLFYTVTKLFEIHNLEMLKKGHERTIDEYLNSKVK